MTPREIVAELDKYVVGQGAAKRAVAIALRNRMRRQKLSPELAEDIMPKNIIMIGPTGVGKTEIARRLAKLTSSPFLKVEASKFTEVGYVGRDVESIVRDLVEIAIDMVREEKMEDVEDKAELNAEDRLLDLLLPPPPTQTVATSAKSAGPTAVMMTPTGIRAMQVMQLKVPEDEETVPGTIEGKIGDKAAQQENQSSHERTREKLRQQFREGRLDERMVEIDVRDRNQPSFEFLSTQGPEEMDMNLREMLPGLFGQRTKKRKMKVAEAFEYLVQEEESRLIDMDQVTRLAVERVEDSGIVFLDEIDKIAGREAGHGPDVSREGVQRDILPIVEGTTVNTKYGMVSTDHILFIAAGAFHVSKPSDLIPELQGQVSHPRGAEVADGGGLCADSERAEVVAGEAVDGAAGDRGAEAGVYAGGAGGDGAVRVPGERDDGEHRRAAAAHDHGAGAGRDQLPGAGAVQGAEGGGFAGGRDRRGGRVGAADRRAAEALAAAAGDRAEEGRRDGGEGDRGRSGVREAAGGFDREGPGPEPLYLVAQAALEGAAGAAGARCKALRKDCGIAQFVSSELGEDEPVVPFAASLLQRGKLRGEAVGFQE